MIFSILSVAFYSFAENSDNFSNLIGTQTQSLIKKGIFNTSCEDAELISSLMQADNFTVVAFFLDNDSVTLDSLPKDAKGALIAFTESMDNFTKTISAPFSKNSEILGVIESNILNHDINNISQVATITYIGLIDIEEYNKYIQISFCGEQAPSEYKSPFRFSEEEISEAIAYKIEPPAE